MKAETLFADLASPRGFSRLLLGLLLILLFSTSAGAQLLCDDPVAVFETPSDQYSFSYPAYTAPDDAESVTVTALATWADDWYPRQSHETTYSNPILVETPFVGGNGCDDIYDHPENHYTTLAHGWAQDSQAQGSLVIGPGKTVHIAGSDCGLHDNYHAHHRVEVCVEENVSPPVVPPSGCADDDFASLDGSWSLTQLGDADDGGAVATGGQVHLSGDGSSLYHGDDNAAFLHQPVTGDFRAEVDITGVPVDQGGVYRKGGLMVREGSSPDAPRVMVQYIPHFPTPDRPALQFDYRGTDGVAHELGSTVQDVALPVRVAIQRRGHIFSVFFSSDGGTTWTQPLGGAGGQVEIQMSSQVEAGLAVASYDADPATFSFDDFALCQSYGDPPTPTNLPCSAGPRDIVYLLDTSDSMRRPHGDPNDGVSKFEAARGTLLAINDALAQQGDGSRAALVTFEHTYSVVRSGFTDDFDHLASLLSGIHRPVLSPYDPQVTTPGAIGLDGARALLDAERVPGHPVVILWPTDGLPNIDRNGGGIYPEQALASLDLSDGFGGFLPSGAVADLGYFVAATGAFIGRPLADSMVAIEDLRDSHGDLRIMSLVPRGSLINPFNPPVFPEGLHEYAAYYTQGAVFGAVTPAGLEAQTPALLEEISCGQPGLGSVSGTLWRDQDGDGALDVGEPGIGGVTVQLGAAATTTDSSGFYSFTGLAAGNYTVTVSSGDLPADANLPTYDADGAASAHTAAVTVNPWAGSSADFGYGTDGGGSTVIGCSTDSFNAIGSSWILSSLGDADQVNVASIADELHLSGDGTSLYAGSDHGAFLHQRIEGTFRMEVDVTGFPVDAGGSYRKAGLMARAGLSPDDARVILQYVPNFGGSGRPVLQFRYRASAGSPGDAALGSNLYDVPLPVRLAIEQEGGVWSVSWSTDGGNTWKSPTGGSGGSIALDLGDAPYVGPNVVSYAANTALTASFDELSLCGP